MIKKKALLCAVLVLALAVQAALAEGFDPTRYRLTPGIKRETLERLGWLEGT